MPRSSGVLQDGRFLLFETLGRGSMGTVHRAFDRAERRFVALKIPIQSGRSGPAHPLSTEFEAWHRQRHPNIVRAYELAVSESGPIERGTPYLVLQDVRGDSVDRSLCHRRVCPTVVRQVAEQLLDALAEVHRSGWVHRDVKPANVLVCTPRPGRTRVRLTDFGLAAPTGTRRDVGTFSGSLPFVAPEALCGGPLDGRCDLYALGILLARLALGRLPCPGRSIDAVLRWHLDGPAVDLHPAVPGVPPRLARLVRVLTHRRPAARPNSAERAMDVLGLRPRASRVDRPACDLATRATLRLALDAARLGGWRTYVMPRNGSVARVLLDEVSVWTQTRGLKFYRIRGSAAGLAGWLVRLTADFGEQAVRDARSLGLQRWLPVEWMDRQPLLRARDAPDTSAACPSTGARHLIDLMARCARRRALVVHVARGEGDAPLVRALVGRLRGMPCRPVDPTRGGALVLLPAPTTRPVSRTRRRAARRSPDAATAPRA